jgi:hypothetical protein
MEKIMTDLTEFLYKPASPEFAIYGMISVGVFFLVFVALYDWWEKRKKDN